MWCGTELPWIEWEGKEVNRAREECAKIGQQWSLNDPHPLLNGWVDGHRSVGGGGEGGGEQSFHESSGRERK